MENLRRIRKSKGLTMKDLGKAVGVSESMIGMIETGKRNPGYELLLKLSEELGCTYEDLIDGEKNPVTSGDGLVDKDARLLMWFRSLPPEKQKAILISQDAPEDLL